MTLYRLFALTIFVSSFLLFQVQPLISKHILPWFGGSSAVWVTAMFFFMVMLAVGYGYALWLTKLTLKRQLLTHGLLLLGAVTLLWYQKQVWSVSVTPGLSDLNIDVTDPTLSIIVVLLITIGLPFALLSSSSTLLQFWYARLSQQEPFSLYSVSNVGSLLGLLTFPFLFEPMLSTVYLGQVWANGFFVYVLLILSIGWQLFKLVKVESEMTQATEAATTKVNHKQFLRWLLVASIPVLTMLAGTAFLTTAIAPVPLLWVGPLALYLVSFIVSFRAEPDRVPVFFNEVFVLVTSVFAMMTVLSQVILSVAFSIVLVHVAMFSFFHWCHEHLYATRPPARNLPIFYMALALGGILGSVVMLTSTHYLLVLPIELIIIFSTAVLVIAYRWYRRGLENLDCWVSAKSKAPILGFIVVTMIFTGTFYVYQRSTYALELNRNFFGYKAVLEYTRDIGTVRALQHGATQHGFQVWQNKQPVIETASYYGESAGVGIAFEYLKSNNDQLNVVALGLGAGILSVYCRAGDRFEFIEIDPQIITLTRQYFSYLDHCPQARVTEADGRLALSRRIPEAIYDLIVIDAYADDMVPIHIMTSEAMAIYRSLLKDQGIIALHISSRYLELLPVVAALSEAGDFALRTWYDQQPSNPALNSSHWVLLAKSDTVFEAELFSAMSTAYDIERRVTWTDTHSALWPIVKLW